MMNLPPCLIQNLQVSARLRISEFTWQDAADLARMHQNPRVRELLMDDLPLDTTNAAQRFIDGMQRFYRQYEGTGIWRAEPSRPMPKASRRPAKPMPRVKFMKPCWPWLRCPLGSFAAGSVWCTSWMRQTPWK